MKLYELTVTGKNHTWSFEVLADPIDVEDWTEDELVVDEIENLVPYWASSFPVLFCTIQDLLNFKNPFEK